jgi:lipopolysaccharide transport system permease protein
MSVSNITEGALEGAGGRAEKPRRVKVIRAPTFSPRGLLSGLRDLWRYRDLLYTLSVHRVRVRYKQSLLGVAWALLQPLSLMLIYTLVFAVIAKIPTGGTPYPVTAYTGLLLWTLFSTALINSTGGLVSHANLVTRVYFPREILPLTYVVAALFDFAVASTLLAGLMAYYGLPVTWHALYALPIVAVLVCFVTAVALIFSALQVRFRDVGVAMPLLLQLWMFATPVVYPLGVVPERFRGVYSLNPMVGVVENFRNVILAGAAPDFYTLGLSALISLALLPAAYLYFKHVEATLADII